ncbi:hypothetical protein LHYA1_G005086 [Lachnellula hyalina]|uniref:Cupin type-2 domain-containing protein n=1 Tax=Lachnellula hyalina TaxID=1316788 RepID=A0A8H8R3C6_9HELO|nr:uncharacterized protein LHYA1_G005086 [Lachnellula hyalina]TVY26960.1 hypothetical protein LHYA1_G005086 [Lachnellula hyalina]
MASQRPALPAVEPTYDINRPLNKIIPLYAHPIPTCPGKSIVAPRVEFPPNGSTPPHTHAGAFVTVNVVSGFVYNKMNDEAMEVFGPGEVFTEGPGCRHMVSDNAGREEAVIVATMVVDTKVLDEGGVEACVVIDEVWREAVMERRVQDAAAVAGERE